MQPLPLHHRVYRRVAPNGVLDIVRQIALWMLVYYTYRLTRGAIDTPDGAIIAFNNARDIIAFEQATRLFFEQPIQQWTEAFKPALDAACWLYMNAQTTIMLSTLIFIYFRFNDHFYFVRNMFMVAMAIALLGYLVYPTAPPRFFPEWGFTDSVSEFVGVSQSDVKVNALFNPYAAVPSMHCANAIMIGLSLAQLLQNRLARLVWAIYPAIMFWVVVATGNHWTIDALLGAATAALSFAGARALALARPGVWEFAPAKATA